jgi:beta-lactamase superfamily II metal-dependent hydrolase
MYRQGLGDCFLLTLPGNDDKLFHMLIDCGVVLGTPNPADRMRAVVADVATVTGNHLGLLVATHEHWDHLSGFVQVQTLFDAIQIDRTWLAWTEDPADPLAKKLKGERSRAEEALRMAVTRLGIAGDPQAAGRVQNLVDFFGAKSSGTTGDALDYVKKRAKGKQKYCKPGEPPIILAEVPGVRFWILGPPRDEKLIKKSNPNQGAAYGLDARETGSQALFIAGLSAEMGIGPDSVLADSEVIGTFDDMYSIPIVRAQQLPFFDRHYFGQVRDGSLCEKVARNQDDSESETREISDQSWRRIDADWLGLSETMALQLDSATNNTSLAIAIELVDTCEVLLFPGDAQAGNWMSWQELKWEADEDEGRKAETGPGLLARTRFYKVGHHGSHNATLKELGLELMASSELIAMIPVDHDMAVKKHWGKMPLPELVNRLVQKTSGRVLRVDDKVSRPEDLAQLRPIDTSTSDWEDFVSRVEVTDLYYELTL